jgi:hypothetical protein
LRARPEQTQLEDLSDASFFVKLLVLPANVRLDWKVIVRYNTLAYLDSSSATKKKKFYNIDTWNCIHYPSFSSKLTSGPIS